LVSALSHAETQLLAQIADETSLDWSPLPFVAFASFRCFTAIFQKETLLGPAALKFYATFGGQTARAAREQLLADLDATRLKNTERAADKSRALKDALRTLFVGLLVAGGLIVFATPSKMESHVCQDSAETRPAAPRSCSGAVRSPAGWHAWRPRIAPPPVH
jgi:hypothetical protein